MNPTEDVPGDPPERVTIRPSDLPLLYLLLFIHTAVIASLPVAAWFIVRFLDSWPDESKPRFLVPALLVALVLVEVALGWRLRRVWRRVRRVRG
jgi:hypothetical protein